MLRIETNPIAQGPARCRRRAVVRLAHAFSCCLLVLPIACVERAWALEPTTALASYGRQTWVMENGLPQNTVQALAQTRDGFVWLGTEVGLVRFDGNSFVLFDQNSKPALPGNDIQCLLATDDGALWIGTRDGLARFQNGSVTTFTTENGLPGNFIRALREREDIVNVSTQNGSVEIKGSRVTPLLIDWNDGPRPLFHQLTNKVNVTVYTTAVSIGEKIIPSGLSSSARTFQVHVFRRQALTEKGDYGLAPMAGLSVGWQTRSTASR